MPPEATFFIVNHGYFAIFILVFIQEMGIPNPLPNELVLMFSGYLSLKGILFLPLIIFTAVSADFIGTVILYGIFYFSGSYIIKHKPRWIFISEKKINSFSLRITNGGQWAIYMGRVTPFVRGYTSIITGLLQIKPKIFLPIAFISGILWATTCVVMGRVLGPYWTWTYIGSMKFIIILFVMIFLLICSVLYLKKGKRKP